MLLPPSSCVEHSWRALRGRRRWRLVLGGRGDEQRRHDGAGGYVVVPSRRPQRAVAPPAPELNHCWPRRPTTRPRSRRGTKRTFRHPHHRTAAHPADQREHHLRRAAGRAGRLPQRRGLGGSDSDPGCKLSWGVIAAIGQVESGHGRFGGAASSPTARRVPSIFGFASTASAPSRPSATATTAGSTATRSGTALSARCSSSRPRGRSSAPMVTGMGKDPNDFDDATLATARYLCSGGDNMSYSPRRAGGPPLQPVRRLRRPGADPRQRLRQRRRRRRTQRPAAPAGRAGSRSGSGR